VTATTSATATTTPTRDRTSTNHAIEDLDGLDHGHHTPTKTTTVTTTATRPPHDLGHHDQRGHRARTPKTSTTLFDLITATPWSSAPWPPVWSCPVATSTGGAGGSSASTRYRRGESHRSDCKSLADLRRPILKAQSQSQLDQVRASLIATTAAADGTVCLDSSGTSGALQLLCPHGHDGGGFLRLRRLDGHGRPRPASAPGAGGAAGSGSTSATEYSTTNTQVASVDEAEYVKTDANHHLPCCRATACT